MRTVICQQTHGVVLAGLYYFWNEGNEVPISRNLSSAWAAQIARNLFFRGVFHSNSITELLFGSLFVNSGVTDFSFELESQNQL